MINYLKADFYRIFNKTSLYIFFSILLIIFLFLVLIKIMPIKAGSILQNGLIIFEMLLIIGGGFLFTAIYNDDLTSKSLPQLIGFGKKRTLIVVSKLVVNIVISGLVYTGAFIVFYLIINIFGVNVNFETIGELIKIALNSLFRLYAYSIIASIIAYGTQKATISIVSYVILATGFIDQILSLLLGRIEGMVDGLFLNKYTILQITDEMVSNPSISAIIPYLIALMVFITLSIIAFRKKDLEF